MTLPGHLTHGIPPGDPWKQFARELAELKRMVLAQQAALNAKSVLAQSFSADATGLSFPSGGGFSQYAVTSAVTVPDGVTSALIFASAYAGCTFTTAGNISVGIGDATASSSGPFSTTNAIANGTGSASACSVCTSFSIYNTSLTPGQNNWFAAMVAANGTSGSSGNAHVNGVVLWLKS